MHWTIKGIKNKRHAAYTRNQSADTRNQRPIPIQIPISLRQISDSLWRSGDPEKQSTDRDCNKKQKNQITINWKNVQNQWMQICKRYETYEYLLGMFLIMTVVPSPFFLPAVHRRTSSISSWAPSNCFQHISWVTFPQQASEFYCFFRLADQSIDCSS